VRMKDLLKQQGLDAALEELPTATIVAYDNVSGSRADGYGNADLMMVMSVEQLLDWIMDSRGSYHMTYKRDYLFDFEEYDGGNVLLGDGRECRVWGIGKVQVQMRDKVKFVLTHVKVYSRIKAKLDIAGNKKANCVYTLDGQAVTRKTLKGRKQLGEYQTGCKIKTGNSSLSKVFDWLASINQGILERVKAQVQFLDPMKQLLAVGNCRILKNLLDSVLQLR
ncbi:hypothetical protein Tco_1233144, partial [Tanacetum coccineum]